MRKNAVRLHGIKFKINTLRKAEFSSAVKRDPICAGRRLTGVNCRDYMLCGPLESRQERQSLSNSRKIPLSARAEFL